MECVLETSAATILEFIQGLRGTLSLTFEEGTSAAWLHDLLKPQTLRCSDKFLAPATAPKARSTAFYRTH
jgi:hypothetical protein